MNKKLIFRILGALASALIVVSVFVPFIKVTGYTSSIWQTFELTNSLYLPIMIIVFGVIGIIFFSLNIKTEFAYMSTGAITFFLVVQTVDILNQGVFNTLSIGYYFLIIGAVLTGLMAFLMNLKQNKEIKQTVINEQADQSMLNQIDNLYNNENITNPINTIQPIQPLPVEQNIQSVPVEPVIQPIPMEPITESIQSEPVIQPISTEPIAESIQPVPVIQTVPTEPITESMPSEPVIKPVELVESPQQINPVLEQFNQPNMNFQQNTAPALQTQLNNQQIIPNNNISQSNINQPQMVNPVVQEFLNPQLSSTPENNLNKDGVDIFGQPINK